LGLDLAHQEQRTGGTGENSPQLAFFHAFSPWRIKGKIYVIRSLTVFALLFNLL
jgi:hypothetical protein